jgi:hypothetical protein
MVFFNSTLKTQNIKLFEECRTLGLFTFYFFNPITKMYNEQARRLIYRQGGRFIVFLGAKFDFQPKSCAAYFQNVLYFGWNC